MGKIALAVNNSSASERSNYCWVVAWGSTNVFHEDTYWLITERSYHIAVMGKTVNVTKPSWDEVMNHSGLTMRAGIDEAAGKGFERLERGVYEASSAEPLTAGGKQIEFTGRSIYNYLSKESDDGKQMTQ